MMRTDWIDCHLEDVLTLKRGYDLPRQNRTIGEVPIVSSSGISGYHDVPKVKGPGVVTGRYGTLGEVFFVACDFWPLNTALYVQDFKGNDQRFIAYFMQALDLGNRSGAAAVPGLNRNDLHRLAVRKPPLPTQSKIAAILSAYDDLIENNTRRIKTLEEMAEALYREWFVHFRFPGHEKVSRVDSPPGEIPKGWRAKQLRELAQYINRGIGPQYDENAPGLVINQKCIRDGRLTLDAARRQSKKVPPEKLVRFGDILINSTGIGTLGRVAQVYEDLSHCTVDSHVTIVRPANEFSVDFLGLALIGMETHFDHLGAGSTGQTELSRELVSSSAVLVPPAELQKEFSEIVGPLRHAAIIDFKKMRNLRRTRDLLLPKLVSGEIDVSNLDIR